MKKKLFSTLFSFLLVFTLFVGAPVNQVMASEVDPGNELQQRSKEVTYRDSFGTPPPQYYFYNSGGYAGYIGLESYYYDGDLYHATYRGTVYDSPPYPIPPAFSSDKKE